MHLPVFVQICYTHRPMTNPPAHSFKNCLYPYQFALKEGKDIQKNFLDFSLMLVQVHNAEVIRSPISPADLAL